MIYYDHPKKRIIVLFGEGTVGIGPALTDPALHLFNLREPNNLESLTGDHAPVVLVFKTVKSVDTMINRLEFIRDRLMKEDEGDVEVSEEP